MVTVDDCSGKTIFAGQGHLPGAYIEKSTTVASINGLRVQLVAYSKIQGQRLRHLPIILKVAAHIGIALSRPIQQLCSLAA